MTKIDKGIRIPVLVTSYSPFRNIMKFLSQIRRPHILVPRLASAVTLACGLRLWRGFTHRLFNNTANCPLRDYATHKRWPWNREEGGEDTDGDQRR